MLPPWKEGDFVLQNYNICRIGPRKPKRGDPNVLVSGYLRSDFKDCPSYHISGYDISINGRTIYDPHLLSCRFVRLEDLMDLDRIENYKTYPEFFRDLIIWLANKDS